MLRRVLLALSLAAVTFAALPPGRPLPDVPVSMPGGKSLDLKQYRGKALIVAMISTTCEDCAHATDFLKIIQTEYAPQGLQVIAIAGDPEGAEALKSFEAAHKPNYPLGFLARVPFLKLAGMAPDERPFAPILMFVDPKGVARIQFLGNDPLMNKMETLIRSTVRELMKEPGITKGGK